MIRARVTRTKSFPFYLLTNKFIFVTAANLNSLKYCLNVPFFTPLSCSKISHGFMSSIKSGYDNLAQPSLNHSCYLTLPSLPSRVLSEVYSSLVVSKSHIQECICPSLENARLGGHIFFALSGILQLPQFAPPG